jgi:transcription initiation factor IIF auxiliary subunit
MNSIYTYDPTSRSQIRLDGRHDEHRHTHDVHAKVIATTVVERDERSLYGEIKGEERRGRRDKTVMIKEKKKTKEETSERSYTSRRLEEDVSLCDS